MPLSFWGISTMVDWSSIPAQISSTLAILKQASGLVKDISPLLKGTEANEKLKQLDQQLLEASETIIALRKANNALANRLFEVEAEIDQLKAFTASIDKLTKHQLLRGSVVYIFQDMIDAPNQATWYCQYCVEINHLMSPLSRTADAPRGMSKFECSHCGRAFADYAE